MKYYMWLSLQKPSMSHSVTKAVVNSEQLCQSQCTLPEMLTVYVGNDMLLQSTIRKLWGYKLQKSGMLIWRVIAETVTYSLIFSRVKNFEVEWFFF